MYASFKERDITYSATRKKKAATELNYYIFQSNIHCIIIICYTDRFWKKNIKFYNITNLKEV